MRSKSANGSSDGPNGKRRLVRDTEQRFDVSAAMILVAFGSLLQRRISH